MDQIADTETKNLVTDIPNDYPLTDINLPNQWVLYLYDKQLFKKMANRPGFNAKPHKEICTITSVNDLVYILQLMGIKHDVSPKNPKSSNPEINLDANDYIIMRKGIEPIWEDPKNSNGGTFTIKMIHSKGYDVWSTFIMYMLGETMTPEMHNINGMTVSYISDNNNPHNISNSNSSYTYIKLWDAKSDRTREQFLNILPLDLVDKIKNESILYSRNNEKKHYGEKNIVDKLNNHNRPSYGRKPRGGFINNPNKRY